MKIQIPKDNITLAAFIRDAAKHESLFQQIGDWSYLGIDKSYVAIKGETFMLEEQHGYNCQLESFLRFGVDVNLLPDATLIGVVQAQGSICVGYVHRTNDKPEVFFPRNKKHFVPRKGKIKVGETFSFIGYFLLIGDENKFYKPIV